MRNRNLLAKNRKEVDENTAKELAKSRGYQYFEASTKIEQGVNDTFEKYFGDLNIVEK